MKASSIVVHCSYEKIANVKDLVPNPRNPNKHGDKQIALLAKIIKHQGWRSPITISNRSGFIVAGHGRLQAAKLLKVEEVPVDYQDFASDADELAHISADNRLAELAEIDAKILGDIVKELSLDSNFDVQLTGFDSDEIESLTSLAFVQASGNPEWDSVFSQPEIEKASLKLKSIKCTKCGEIFQL